MASRILPLEKIDQAIGGRIHILMRGTKEMVGTLRGFDDYVRPTTEESMHRRRSAAAHAFLFCAIQRSTWC
jgi:small nuclear ribonucleoprotein (snRNP)-like protein